MTFGTIITPVLWAEPTHEWMLVRRRAHRMLQPWAPGFGVQVYNPKRKLLWGSSLQSKALVGFSVNPMPTIQPT